MATKTTTWRTLLDRINRLHASGKMMEGAISDLSEGGATVFYDSAVLSDLAKWIHDAHRLAVDDRRDSIVVDLAEAVREWTGGRRERTLHEAGAELSLSDFSVIEQIEEYGTDDKGRRRLRDIEDYADPLDTRYRLQRLILDLLSIARIAGRLKPPPPDESKSVWDLEEMAAWLKIAPGTLNNWLSKRRTVVGTLPSFVMERGGAYFQVPAVLQLGFEAASDMLSPPNGGAKPRTSG